jgi:hypothetical protein
MKIETLEEAVVFANYDIPAPDMWKNHYEIQYLIPFDSDLWERVKKFNIIRIKELLSEFFADDDRIELNNARKKKISSLTNAIKSFKKRKKDGDIYLNLWKLGFGKFKKSKKNEIKFLNDIINNKKGKLWNKGKIVKKNNRLEYKKGKFTDKINDFIKKNYNNSAFWNNYHQKEFWKNGIHKVIKEMIRDILYSEDNFAHKKIYNNYRKIGKYTKKEKKALKRQNTLKDKQKQKNTFEKLKKKLEKGISKKNQKKIIKAYGNISSKEIKKLSETELKVKTKESIEDYIKKLEKEIEDIELKITDEDRERIDNISRGETFRMKVFKDLIDSGIRVRPIRARNADFWEKLSKKQKKHNKYVWKGIQDSDFEAPDGDGRGLKEIYEKYPSLEGEYIGEFNENSRRKEEWAKYEADGRLMKIRWRHRDSLFSSEDEIINPKYWNKLKKSKRTGEKVPSHMDKMIPINQAFISARSTLNSRLKKNEEFIPNMDSSYILPLDLALAPNAYRRDNNGNKITELKIVNGKKIEVPKVFHDPQKPPANYVWKYKVLEDGSVDAKFEGYLEGKGDKKAPRLPDDPFANTFEEIFVHELLPLYNLLEDFMKDEDRQFKHKYIFGFDKLLKESFDDWFSLYAVKPINYRSFQDLARGLAKDWYNQNPDLFKKVQDELKERKEKFVIDESLSGYKRTARMLTTRKDKRYLRTIKNTYYFADVLNDKDNVNRFVKRFNAMLKIYNHKKNTDYPLLDGSSEFLFDFTKYLLGKMKWYYTIPNSLTNVDPKIKEPEALMIRRMKIESYIKDIEEKIREMKQQPEHMEKKEYSQSEIEDLMTERGKSYLRQLLKEVIVNEEEFKNPDELKQLLKRIYGSTPSESMLKKEYKREQKEKQKEEKKKKERFKKVIEETFFKGIPETFEELEETISPKELNSLLEKGIIEEEEDWLEIEEEGGKETEEEEEEKEELTEEEENLLKEFDFD